MLSWLGTAIAPLILLSSAWACGINDDACPRTRGMNIDAGQVVAMPAHVVPAAAHVAVDGVECIMHAVTSFGPDVPRHASHTPRMAVRAGNKGAASAKARACEGVMGFNTFSSFLLRTASSSFWALVSGIWRS